MLRPGKRAVFTIKLPHDGTLQASASFREDGYNVGMVSYHPQLAPWVRLPACSHPELRDAMTAAARALGGELSVEYTPLASDGHSLAPAPNGETVAIKIPVQTPRPTLAATGHEEQDFGCSGGPPDG
jgi:hypothetical protein